MVGAPGAVVLQTRPTAGLVFPAQRPPSTPLYSPALGTLKGPRRLPGGTATTPRVLFQQHPPQIHARLCAGSYFPPAVAERQAQGWARSSRLRLRPRLAMKST